MVFKNKVVVTPENGLLISIKGPISIDHVYSQIQQWFGRYKYDFTEKEHTEKNKPQGNELLIKWSADRKIDDYMQYYVDIEFLITELRKVGGDYHAKTKINLKGYKILGEGEVKEKLTINASAASSSAIDKIKKAGGNIILEK